MNSGLMQVMAYLRDKGWDSKKKEEKRQEVLARQLRAWLGKCFSTLPDEPKDFESFMEKLMGADAREYQEITAEAFAWLRWLRQMAASRCRFAPNLSRNSRKVSSRTAGQASTCARPLS